MSKFDHGKHPKYTEETAPSSRLIGQIIPGTKRLDAQKESPQLAGRIRGFQVTTASLKGDGAKGFNKPGSQQRRSK